MRLGQVMLIDRAVAQRQVEFAEISNDDTVLEIGPGRGILTRELEQRARRVVAIEIDQRYARSISEKFPGIEVIEGDARTVELPEFNKVVSNIPYYISSEITFRLLGSGFERGVVMYQREFAERMAGESQISRLTVNIALRCDCELLEIVPRHSFKPVPKVDSAIVSLVPKEPEFDLDPEFLDAVLKAVFSSRRKKMAGVLSRSFGIDRSLIEPLLPDADCRVDDMYPEDVLELAEVLSGMVE